MESSIFINYIRSQFYYFISKATLAMNENEKLSYFHLAQTLWEKNPCCFTSEDASVYSFEDIVDKTDLVDNSDSSDHEFVIDAEE